jgi:hypothetical protein
VNAAGLTFLLSSVVAGLNMAFYQNIVTEGSVSQDEFDGTLANLTAIHATLRNTPGPKIEAMVDQNNAELSAHLSKFQGEWTSNPLQGFRDAQTLAGYVATILVKSGLHE